MSIKDKLLKNTTLEFTDTLLDSKIYGHKDDIPTKVPMINVLLSGTTSGGLTSGVTMLAGPSKHFKTGFALLLASAFIQKYPDGVILFYDSEFGSPQSYFDNFGIPLESVIHCPVVDIEQLKFDIMKQLSEIERGEHVLILIDSIGNLASKKEVEDSLDQKSVADMTRAKQFKSLFRMITPHLSLKDIPLIAVNHTYKTIELYSKDVVGGGTGAYYGADNIWIIGRQQEKEGDKIIGWNFVVNVEKSRYVREKSKIAISLTYDNGINRYSGMFDAAKNAGLILQAKVGWYNTVDPETGEISAKNFRKAEIEGNKDFWERVLVSKKFEEYISGTYGLENAHLDDKSEVEEG